jgi:hypothetical protein
LSTLDTTPTNDFSKASYFLIIFQAKLDGVAVYRNFVNTSQATVLVNKYKTVTQVTYQYSDTSNFTPRNFPLITFDDAKSKILQSEGTIVNFTPGQNDPKNNATMDSAILNSVEMVYFDDRKSGYIQPIFLFRGEATYPDSSKQPIIIYLPAVAGQTK